MLISIPLTITLEHFHRSLAAKKSRNFGITTDCMVAQAAKELWGDEFLSVAYSHIMTKKETFVSKQLLQLTKFEAFEWDTRKQEIMRLLPLTVEVVKE